MQDLKSTGEVAIGKSSIELDIGIPTPVEVARQLEGLFNQEQAESIAEYVYQPIREALKILALKGLK